MENKRLVTDQLATRTIKNAVNAMIKYISIIAIFVSIGLIALLYLGPEINLTTGIVFRLAVPSVVLALSTTIIYELWIKNGRRSGFEEDEYQDLLKLYAAKSENLHYPTVQDFLDAERQRRYDVEFDRLSRLLNRELELLTKIDSDFNNKRQHSQRITWRDKIERWSCNRSVKLITKSRDRIRVSMPYEKSEEFDYLRYNLQDVIYKEYSPNDTKKHLNKARRRKYANTWTFTLIGLNILSIGGSMGNLWVALIMTSIAAVTLLYAVAQGFSVGYNNIKVVSTGIYKTANSFLDQAVAYCKRTGKDLYYKGTTDYRTVELPKSVITVEVPKVVEVSTPQDIFTKAANEVT